MSDADAQLVAAQQLLAARARADVAWNRGRLSALVVLDGLSDGVCRAVLVQVLTEVLRAGDVGPALLALVRDAGQHGGGDP